MSEEIFCATCDRYHPRTISGCAVGDFAKLTAELSACKRDRDSHQRVAVREMEASTDLKFRLSASEQEVARLRGALEWYANPEIYKPHPHGPAFDDRDLSFKAKEALQSSGGVKGRTDGERLASLQQERDWLLEELVKESATLIHSSATNSKSFEECLNETRFTIEEHLRTLYAK